MIADLKFALRHVRKSPGFTFVAVLTLALGIGLNTAIFSIVHSVLLSELPYPDPDRLVAISETIGGSTLPTSYPDYLDWRAAKHSFDEIAVSRRDDFNLIGDGQPERFSGLFVTASYFRVLKVPPKVGRTFFDEEDSAAGVNPIILSEHLWRSRFGADPTIVGRKLTLNTISCEVVGVAAENLSIVKNPETARNSQGTRNVDLYAPFGFYATRPYMHSRSSRLGFYGIARLEAGVSIEQATADLKVIARNLELKYPDSNTNVGIAVSSLRDSVSVIGKYQAMLWLLEAAVGLVLLITCANIANLLLVRTAVREREIAVRAALGASRARLIAQLLTESAVLAFLGGAFGCLLAFWSKDLITSLSPHDLPRLQEIRLDLPVFAFSALITLGAGLAFGLGPAWRLSKADLITMSKSSDTCHRHRNLGALVIGQVAFACVLLTGAGLLTRTFRALENEPLGFNPNHLLMVGIKLPGLKYHEPSDQAKFYEELLEKVERLPGVKAAAIDDDVPFSGFRSQEHFAVTGQPQPRHNEEPLAEAHCISPDYFRTMGIPLLQGRTFGRDDVLGKPFVIMIDEELARKFFPGRDPIGQQLNQRTSETDTSRTHYTIVGIVPSVRHGEVGIEPKIPQIYWAAAQFSWLQTTLLVRTEGEPAALLPSIRAAVRSIDPQLPIFGTRTMEEAVVASIGTQRLSATLIAGFSILALFLAALGLYGVLAYSVTQRTREIGIRIALGSPRSGIYGLIVRRAMMMVGLGIFAGVALAIGCGPLIGHFVYGVAPYDPATVIGVAALLIASAILACLLPARRAALVDPIQALRTE